MKNLFYREKDAREVLEYDYKQLAHEFCTCDNPPKKVPYYRLRPIHFGH
jgi:hypothetical protein